MSDQPATKPYYLNLLCGGRMAKFKGVAASIAPTIGAVGLFTGLSAGVASANNECGINTPGPTVLTCPAGIGGIIYNTRVVSPDNAGDGMTLILDDENIVLSGLQGVQVRTSDVNTDDITVNALGFGSITTTGPTAARGFWVSNRGTAGDVDVLIGLNAGSIQTNGFQSYGALAELGRLDAVGNVSAAWWEGSYTSLGETGIVIYAFSRGTGTTHSEMNGGTGDLRGINSTGVFSFISNPGNTSDATALLTGGGLILSGTGSDGVRARTTGLGSASASMSGGSIEMSGDGGSGVEARVNIGAGSSTVTVTGGTVTATGSGTLGAFARNQGAGAASVFVSGDSIITSSGQDAFGIVTVGTTYAVQVDGTASVTGGTGSGTAIYTVSAADSSGTIAIGANATVDGSSGAAGIRDDDGNTIVTTAGTVIGDAILGLGNDEFNLTGGTYTGDIYGDGTTSTADDGDDTFNWTGGDLNSGFLGGNGSDAATIASGANYDGTETFNGGDDYSATDGWVDTLTFQGQTATTQGALVTNWENVIIDGGEITFSDNMLEVGADPFVLDTPRIGLTLTNGAALNARDAFTLTGNLITTASGIFDATGGGTGVYLINGSVANAGQITMQDANGGAVGDMLTVSDDFEGGGALLVDVDTATDAADRLVIDGNVTGVTQVGVRDVSVGASTGNDITVITVGGTSAAGDFVLAGGPLVAGAFNYDLEYDPGVFVPQTEAFGSSQFVLRSLGVNGTGAVYEAAPAVLGGFNRLSTLEQRVGQRQWAGAGAAAAGMQPSGAWLRLQGDRTDLATDTGTSISNNSWGLQAGVDFNVEPSETGQWVLGVTGQYGTSNASVSNALGFGSIDSDGYGLGLTATWYGNNGTYFDAQAQVNWISSDFSSSAGGELATGQDSTAYALSAEVGHRFELSETTALVPQAQLVWGQVDGASFTDTAGNAVDLGSNSSTMGRIGLAYEYESVSASGNNQKVYAIGNILHDFSGANTVDVAGASLSSDTGDTWGEIGFGGSVAVNETTNFYGEVSYRQAFDNSDSNALAATAGFSFKW